ncbi:MAG: hypothetical protein A4S17_00475 [Proteobacteria bacterium HN_bin10]|nr:MAG: hypothetical protein A4S17_00475 [Proteobacteria bacterium HN_bin10]
MGDVRSANSVDVRLGQRVRARRLDLGMSQERLAELLGVTFQQVQKYEKGVNRIAASRLYDICIALETTVARVFEDIGRGAMTGAHGRAETSSAVDGVLATSEGSQLITLFASIKSPKVRRRVVELVKAMASGDR